MLKKEKKKDKKVNIIRKVLFVILIVILMYSLIFIGKYVYNRVNSNKDRNVIDQIKIDESKITEEKTETILKLEELQKNNQDIVAYLEIAGTKISYPVLQTNNNDYYMTHNYKKEYSKDGSIFLDKDYDWNVPDTNLLIYGHNNKNGNMFEDLIKYKDEAFYKKHPIIKFTTNSEDAEYEIIAVFLSRVYYKSEKDVFRYYYFVNAETENEYNEYIKNSKKASLYDTGKSAQYGDQLLTLSTCSYHTEDGRLAIVAKKK